MIRGGLRIFRRRPGLAWSILVVLAIGIGATATAFSFLSALVFRPLPYPEAHELTLLWQTQAFVAKGPLSYGDFREWRSKSGPSFSSIGAASNDSVNVRIGAGAARSRRAALVTGEYFETLGIAAARGRLLSASDDVVGGPHVTVISATLWRDAFGGDPNVVGRSIEIDGEAWTVVGVAPEGFRVGMFVHLPMQQIDAWLPLAVVRPQFIDESIGDRYLLAFGRRKPGVSIEAAEAQMAIVAAERARRYPEHNTKSGVYFREMQRELTNETRSSFWLGFLATALVFFIACANVANLLLVDAVARRTEMAVRTALGATRGRLVRQVIAETWLLFLAAAAGGAVIALGLVHVLAPHYEAELPAFTFHIDGLVLAFIALLASCTGLVVGVVPALEATRVVPQSVLKEAETRAPLSRRSRLLRNAFVVAQVTLAFGLLAGTDYALRTYAFLAAVPPGFDPTNVHTGRVTISGPKYERDGAEGSFYDEVLTRLGAEPDVDSAALTSQLPCERNWSNNEFDIEGEPPFPPAQGPLLWHSWVKGDIFRALGIRIVSGRAFTKDEGDVVVINAFARDRFFGGKDPVGRRITFDRGAEWAGKERRWLSIVGVAANVRQLGLDNELVPQVYVALRSVEHANMAVVVRGPAAAIPRAVHAVDPAIAVANEQAMTAALLDSIAPIRTFLDVMLAAAAAALLLATIGVLGVVGVATAQRTREIGLRMALGATPGRVVALVVFDALRLVGLGLAIGAAIAVVMGRELFARHYVPQAFDGLGLGVVALVLLAAGLGASLVPALRAARLSPAFALRDEGAT